MVLKSIAIGIILALVAVFLITVMVQDPGSDSGMKIVAPISSASSPGTEPEQKPNPSLAPVTPTRPAPPSDDSGQSVDVHKFARLTGWVKNDSGTVLSGIQIEVGSSGFDGEKIVTHSAISNQRGEFLFDALTSGRQYNLEIKPSGEYAGYSLDYFTTDSANAPGEIVLERIELVDVDGMIVDTNHAPIANFELSVHSLTAEFPDRTIRSDSSGYFNLKAFPAGELRIVTNTSDYYRIKGLELRPNEYHNLTLMIDKGSYHLSGWISDTNGAPLREVRVTLKSAFATDEYHSLSYRTTVTDTNGAFEFAELGGHKLTLGIYARGFNTHFQQHEFKSFSDALEIRLFK